MTGKNKRILRRILLCLLFFLCCVVCVTPATAETAASLPEEYYGLEEAIPEDVGELLPDGMFSPDGDTAGDALTAFCDPAEFLSLVLSFVGGSFERALRLCAVLLSVTLLAAVFRSTVASGDTLGKTAAFCVRLCVFSSVAVTVKDTVTGATAFFSRFSEAATATVPLVGTLYAVGGNLGTSVAATGILEWYLSFYNTVAAKTVPLLFAVCLVLLFIGGFGSVDTSPFVGFLKKTFATVSALSSTVLGFLLAVQNAISASDSVGVKGVKVAAQTFVPVVGGTVSGLAGSVAAGVGYLRSSVGVGVILLLLVLILPTLTDWILYRLAFSFCAAVAGLLGGGEEQKLFAGISELYGYLVGVCILCTSVMFISLTLLVKCAVAV